MSLIGERRVEAIKAVATALVAFRTYHRDPEHPFEGGEDDWILAEADAAVRAVERVLSGSVCAEPRLPLRGPSVRRQEAE